MERDCDIILLGLDQKIPDWLVMVLAVAATTFLSGIKPQFGIMGLKHKGCHLGPMVFSSTRVVMSICCDLRHWAE